ncbi:MAG: GTP-binding protein [Gemmatimonadota bacterium]
MDRTPILILGAAGRDFHTFNTRYRDDSSVRVVAFTAQQIPHIDDRRYPPELAGPLYPEGIPIEPETRLEELIRREGIQRCILAYSDLSYEYVMGLAARANVAGAAFEVPAPVASMLDSSRPVVAICASRTGAGKSPTSRAVAAALEAAGVRVGVVRHPMPYGDLVRERVQRFADAHDLEKHRVTIEEREEYEPHIARGMVVWAGVDYEAILREAEKEADVILWDGGNNDTSFFRPDLQLVVVDPHRAGHELSYYPGEHNVRLADVIVVNKVDTAEAAAVDEVEANVRRVNPGARIVRAECPPIADDPSVLEGRRVLAVEDGPTTTHGGMRYGAACIAAEAVGATLVDPRPFAAGEIAETFESYPEVGPLLPAMGYGQQQIDDLQETLRRAAGSGVEAVAVGTPIDLSRLVDIPIPYTRVRYDVELTGGTTWEELLAPVLEAVPRE